MTVAFVLPGGASLGAVQVGMLRALYERGARPDLLVGSSVGALNAAYLAGDPSPEGIEALADLWVTVRRRQIFPIRPFTATLGMLGRRDHLVPPGNLRQWVASNLRYEALEEALVPVHVVATDLETGAPVVISRGSALDALVASAALPAVFPPVEIGGRLLVDGGVSEDTPVAEAARLRADEIYVLPTLDTSEPQRPRGAIDLLIWSIGLMIERVSAAELAAVEGSRTVHVVPPPSTAGTSMFRFHRSAALIDAAYRRAIDWLDERRPLSSVQPTFQESMTGTSRS